MKPAFLIFLFSTVAMASPESTLVKECQLHIGPSPRAKIACTLPIRTAVELVRQGRHYTWVKGSVCEGYVLNSCLLIQKKVGTLEESSRTPTGVVELRRTPMKPFRVGLVAHGGLLLSSVPYASSKSTDFGFGLGFQGRVMLSSRMELLLGTSFLRQNVSREIDASGALTEPVPIEYSQSYSFLTAKAMIGYRLFPSGSGPLEMVKGELAWFLDFGAEYLFPLAASQMSSTGVETEFSPTDKPIFLMLGTSSHALGGEGWYLVTSVHGFYNVAASGGSSAMGARLLLEFNFGI